MGCNNTLRSNEVHCHESRLSLLFAVILGWSLSPRFAFETHRDRLLGAAFLAGGVSPQLPRQRLFRAVLCCAVLLSVASCTMSLPFQQGLQDSPSLAAHRPHRGRHGWREGHVPLWRLLAAPTRDVGAVGLQLAMSAAGMEFQ